MQGRKLVKFEKWLPEGRNKRDDGGVRMLAKEGGRYKRHDRERKRGERMGHWW